MSQRPTQAARLESLIRMLYDVEDQIKQCDDPERLARRQSLSRHVLDLIAEYLQRSDDLAASSSQEQSGAGRGVCSSSLGEHLPVHRRRQRSD